MADFRLPDLGEGLEDATIVEWLVSRGDHVHLNEALCVVETAKTEVTLPSPCSGRIVELNGEPGETVPVGWLLVRIDEGAETDEPLLIGYGPKHATPASAQRPRRRATTPSLARRGGDDVIAVPAARALAEELGIDLGSLGPGSGPGGAITAADVAALADPSDPASPASPADPASPPSPANPGDPANGSTVIAVTGVRARIAARTARSHATIPSASASVWVECDALRRDRTTPLVAMASAVVEALVQHPILNATFVRERDEIHVHDRIGLAVAVATERGLLLPVVRDAARLSVAKLQTEIDRLVSAARRGTLQAADVCGGTFTITNFGALGLDEGVPIISYPQAGILGIGAISSRPVVVDGNLSVRETAKLTCVFDHRVCDGAEVAGFLTVIKDHVERGSLAAAP